MTFPPHLHHLLPLLYILLVHIDLTGLEPLLLTYITIMHLCCIIVHSYVKLLFPDVIPTVVSIIVH